MQILSSLLISCLLASVSAQTIHHPAGRFGDRGVDPAHVSIDPDQFENRQPDGLISRHVQRRQADYSFKIAPRIFLFTHFDQERQSIIKNFPELTDKWSQSVHVPGASPLFPNVLCNSAGDLCLMTLGEGEINAAASIAGLVYSDKFILTHTYFLITGIGGIKPSEGTIGTITFAEWAVQLDLTFEIDARQIPSNFTSGFIPLQNNKPVFYDPSIPPSDPRSSYPRAIYGTEVYRLNQQLRNHFLNLAIASKPVLNDTSRAQAYRAQYPEPAARNPPSIHACDSQTSNVFWSGSLLAQAFSNYTQLLTNGSSTLCITQQEDNATLESLLRAHLAGRIDFARVAIMRAGSDFDRAPPGVDEAFHLLEADQGGFVPGLENIGIVAKPLVKDVQKNWARYVGGVERKGWIGSLFVRL